MDTRRNLIIIIIICIFIGGFIGFQLGVYVTINAVADVASRFMDRSLIEQALYQYKNNIGNCFQQINFTNIST